MLLSMEEFHRILKRIPYTTYIVVLEYKYKHENTYTISNEILSTTGDLSEDIHSAYEWLNDWDEGYDDIKVLGFKDVDSLDITNAIVEEEIIQ